MLIAGITQFPLCRACDIGEYFDTGFFKSIDDLRQYISATYRRYEVESLYHPDGTPSELSVWYFTGEHQCHRVEIRAHSQVLWELSKNPLGVMEWDCVALYVPEGALATVASFDEQRIPCDHAPMDLSREIGKILEFRAKLETKSIDEEPEKEPA